MNQQDYDQYYRENPTARFSVLVTICIGSFLTPLSLSAILVAIPAIAHDLQADARLVSWIPAVFLLSTLIALLPAGRMADTYGRKRIYLIGNVVFVVGTLLAGVVTNIEYLLVFRVVQGMGAAMFFSNGMAIITSVFIDRGRGAALGWVVASVYSGLTCGPLIGGWLTDQYGWHAVFFFQIPFALLGIVLILLTMKGEWRSQNPEPIDWVGAILLAFSLLSFFIGVSSLPDWKAAGFLGGAALLLILLIRHMDRSSSPLVRLKVVWRNRLFSHYLLASVLMYSGSYGLIFLLGLYLQYNHGMTPTEAGRMLMLQAIVMAVLAPLAGRLSDHIQPGYLATAGCLSAAIAFAVFISIDFSTPIYWIGIALLFLGAGFGLFSTPNNSAALGSIRQERLGIGSALLNMSRLMGQMVGTAVVAGLMSIYIGSNTITPDNYDALSQVFDMAVVLSLFFSLAAAYFSFVNVH
ncbi:MFS transporter [Pseudomonadota bacterium]